MNSPVPAPNSSNFPPPPAAAHQGSPQMAPPVPTAHDAHSHPGQPETQLWAPPVDAAPANFAPPVETTPIYAAAPVEATPTYAATPVETAPPSPVHQTPPAPQHAQAAYAQAGHATASSATSVVVHNTVGATKSVGLAVVLALFFGPLGMLYSTVFGAIVMFGVYLTLAFISFVTFGLGVVLYPLGWITAMTWAGIAANMKNRNQSTTIAVGAGVAV